jgi:hypothetical protein
MPDLPLPPFARWLACALLAAAMVAAGCTWRQGTRSEALAAAALDMRAAAARTVYDQERLPLLQAAIDGLEADLDAFDVVVEGAIAELHAMNANPDTTREQMETVLDRFEAQRKQGRLQVIRRHFDLIALTDAAEWSKLAPYERKLLLAAGHKP